MLQPSGFIRHAALALSAAVLWPAAPAAAAPADPSSGWSLVSSGVSAGASARGVSAPREVAPSVSVGSTLDRAAMTSALRAAPREFTAAADRPALLAIPGPDGVLHRFAAVESPVMEPGLAAQVPDFHSYSVVGVDDPSATGRVDLSASLGFHASIRSALGAWYVDPTQHASQAAYVSYLGSALTDTHGGLTEAPAPGLRAAPSLLAGSVETAGAITSPAASAIPAAARSVPAPGSLVQQRVYRLAMASDPAYAAFFGSANVDAAKAAIVNRVDQIYNDDLAIKLVLVAKNALLNFDTAAKFSGARGPCGAAACYPGGDLSCSESLLSANQAAIDRLIGSTAYDVGHLATGTNGGGLAAAGVGDPGYQAYGCTGLTNPVGDNYAVAYFAHEVGHQFGADHTFNGTQTNCAAGNRSDATAVEPGSGSSVMAYAGICGSDDLQAQSDPYFSQRSIEQIQTYVRATVPGVTNGGAVVTTTNRAPVVTVPASPSIPPRTPFTLTGSAADADGNGLVYLWEQNDAGSGTSLVSNTKPTGPLFRQFSTRAVSPDYNTQLNAAGENVATAGGRARTFPDLAQIVAGNTNAATGACPAASSPPTAAQVDCFSEFLPTTARTLHFDLTARDRAAAGGGVSKAETTVRVVGTQPFRVTAPAASATVAGRGSVAVGWSVAATTAAPLSVASVRVLYSTDGGLTFPTVLSASTPNDGAVTVSMPNVATTKGRFKVEAIGQPFFDVSHVDLTVKPVPLPAVTSITPTSGPIAGGTKVTVTGTGFTGTTAVVFGTTRATTFTVVSATKLTVVAPKQTAAAKRVIRVTTPAGTSPSAAAGTFTYK